MSRPFRLHLLAEDDLVEAWTWYEAQGPGLGDRFLSVVYATVTKVTSWPHAGSPIFDADDKVIERRIVTPGFPYVIRYRIVDETILVTAVYHEKRHPDHGSDRMT